MTPWKWYATASAIALTAALAGPVSADVKIDDIIKDAASVGDVVSNGLGPQGQRYSPLKQVNKDTAARLVPAWAFSFGGEKQRGQESQPLVKDGVMYITGSYSRMWAVDVKTGRELWQYDHRLPEGILPCCDVINRGAALFGDKVFFMTLDAKVVALDKKTGKLVWEDNSVGERVLHGASPEARLDLVHRAVPHTADDVARTKRHLDECSSSKSLMGAVGVRTLERQRQQHGNEMERLVGSPGLTPPAPRSGFATPTAAPGRSA